MTAYACHIPCCIASSTSVTFASHCTKEYLPHEYFIVEGTINKHLDLKIVLKQLSNARLHYRRCPNTAIWRITG